MFGLDLSFVILVPERKRGIDTGIQGIFDSLFDLDIRVKPEYDRKGNRLRLGHENDRKFFCKPRNCKGEGKTRRVLEPPAAHTASPFNPLMLFPKITPRTSFLHLKRRAKVLLFTLLLTYYLSSPFQSVSESYTKIFYMHR